MNQVKQPNDVNLSPSNFRRSALGLLCLPLCFLNACGSVAQSDASADTSELASASGDLAEHVDSLAHFPSYEYWPKVSSNYPVKVCFRACRIGDTDPEQNETQQQCDDGKVKVEKALRDFARMTRISLPDTISECANSGDRNPGWVRLNFARVDRNAAGTNHFVRYVNNEKEEKASAGYPGTGWQLRTSTSTAANIVRHEFGHVLGFTHEFKRSDEPAGTTCMYNGRDLTPETGSAEGVTPYDADSIMNSSYCHSKDALSPWDVVGLQSIYGNPFPGTIVNARWGRCFSSGLKLDTCNNAANTKVGYNLTSMLGKRAGVQSASDTRAVLNETSTGGLQWNLNTRPGTDLSATWSLQKAKLVGLGGLCATRGAQGAQLTLKKCADADDATQVWLFDDRSTTQQYVISSGGDSTQCLKQSSSKLITAACSTNPDLSLDIGNGRIKSGSQCLTVDGGAPTVGAKLKFAACDTSNPEQWTIRTQILNANSSQCATAPSSTGALGVTSCSTGGTSALWDIHI